MRKLLIFLLVIGYAVGSEIRLLSQNFYPAGLNIIEIKNPENTKILIETESKTVYFPANSEKSFFAIPYACKKLAILNVIKDNRVIYRKFIRIKPKKYPVSRITVKERKKTEKILKRIINEYKLIRKILSKYTPKKFKETEFIKPVKNPKVSTPFGAKRVINRKKKSIHWGIDYKAPKGTPVFASLSGKVVLAKELFYTGKTVIIDHGLCLYTLYAHLSKIKVKENQHVKGGEIIGNVGSTGRSTGPHLHFGVYLCGERVDPDLAFRLKL
ncbi:Murein DD-endopeptidase MepM and murein hydrolase activator NlpD, contain LysM domain [Persephonella hydrogeniphila]|uniref:Murein DD-endopeptidase MepM and murein hydrolase activator NlpD, contain LysM domain n=1 Tax=Persephonella hydrogeniphila TaxID=198703 RepID=A0A285NHK7_9AQUI|nr:M23 family metallopeptidase [Persephonella hydrogeniphila]SNZ08929.1 Murein DD-endopeptidase MepM and murein hydrolase activator NlpD, contain LysM domain [Persephonella hydrogeniphila]